MAHDPGEAITTGPEGAKAVSAAEVPPRQSNASELKLVGAEGAEEQEEEEQEVDPAIDVD